MTLLSLFARDYSDLQLLKIPDTRFAYMFLMLQRAYVCRDAIEQVFADRRVKDWVAAKDPAMREKHAALRRTALSASFWAKVDAGCTVLAPVFRMLRDVDSDTPTMGIIYNGCAPSPSTLSCCCLVPGTLILHGCLSQSVLVTVLD